MYLCNHTSHPTFPSGLAIHRASGAPVHSVAFSGRFPSAYDDTSPLVGATQAGSLSVWESANKYPGRLLFAIDFSCCLLTPGIFFLCGTITFLCLLTNWTGRCALVYLAPDTSVAPKNQTLPIPLIHNRPKQAIQFILLLICLGIALGIKTRSAGLTTPLNYYEGFSKDLTGSLEEVAVGLSLSRAN